MPSDVDSLLHWTRIMLFVTAICVTLFPVLYGLIAPWYNSHLGRAVLLQSVSVALIIDITAYAQFWPFTSDFKKLLIINVVCFSFISLASLYLTATLLVINLRKKFNRENLHETQQRNVRQAEVGGAGSAAGTGGTVPGPVGPVEPPEGTGGVRDDHGA